MFNSLFNRFQGVCLLSATLLACLNGCAVSSSSVGTADTEAARFDLSAGDGRGAAAEPPSSTTAPARSLLLGTGAVQLGPGLGKNAYRWMGDGQWGF